jgi:putative redox protein
MKYQFEKPIHGIIFNDKYQCTIEWHNGKFIADEPEKMGGKDLGPDPHTLLLSSLATCTLVTLRMYIDKIGWIIPQIAVNVNMYRQTIDGKRTTVIDRDITFPDDISDIQKTSLAEIAQKCPISKILEGDINVRTYYLRNGEQEKSIKYENDEIKIVFDYTKKPWINPEGATSEEIIKQVAKCPSGALSYATKEKEK